jgi:hypothetical protein
MAWRLKRHDAKHAARVAFAEHCVDVRKIWRKFERCAPIGYRLWVRIASHSPIPAQIRIAHQLARTKI